MSRIILNLNMEEINSILAALAQQPYIQVHELIHKIQAQATWQLKEQEEEATRQETEPELVTDNGQ